MFEHARDHREKIEIFENRCCLLCLKREEIEDERSRDRNIKEKVKEVKTIEEILKKRRRRRRRRRRKMKETKS